MRGGRRSVVNGVPDCFALRSPAPFRGTVHLAELGQAQAVTDDGRHWRVQVRARVRPAPGRPLSDRRRVVVCGLWTERGGLAPVPLPPMVDAADIAREAAPLLDALPAAAGRLPFAPRDRFELWLLDGRGRLPLVLLASAVSGPGEVPRFPRWEPLGPLEAGFASEAAQHPRASLPPAERLRRLVKAEAGPAPAAQWFERLPGGGGRARAESPAVAVLAGRHLAPDQFPEALLREAWPEAGEAGRLVADYLAWRAPALLTLHGLGEATRSRLEQAACRQPQEVARLHRLYPAVVDAGALRAARVQAMMQARP